MWGGMDMVVNSACNSCAWEPQTVEFLEPACLIEPDRAPEKDEQ